MKHRRPLTPDLLEQLQEMEIDPEDAEIMMAVAQVPTEVRERYFATIANPSDLGLLRYWRELSDE